MIGHLKGMEILHRIRNGMKVTMVIEVGKNHGPWMNQYSIFFISVAFFIVTAATMGYFIFYSARRLRIARAQSKNQVSLCVCHCFFFYTPEPPCCEGKILAKHQNYWICSFHRKEEEICKTLRVISLNSLKLSKETAKNKLSGESNWLCLANLVSYKFCSLNCGAAVTLMYWRWWELNCF